MVVGTEEILRHVRLRSREFRHKVQSAYAATSQPVNYATRPLHRVFEAPSVRHDVPSERYFHRCLYVQERDAKFPDTSLERRHRLHKGVDVRMPFSVHVIKHPVSSKDTFVAHSPADEADDPAVYIDQIVLAREISLQRIAYRPQNGTTNALCGIPERTTQEWRAYAEHDQQD